MRIAIIDMASVFCRHWFVNKNEVEFKIIGFLKTLQYDRIIVAVDSPPYDRKKIYPEYKASRDIPDPERLGCYRNVLEKVLKEGFQVARAQGWEADDVIATLVNDLTEFGEELFVYGADKDLLQCTDLIDPFTGVVSTPESRFGLKREQIIDYLALVGDASDNIIGVDKVGDKTAVALLNTFGNFDNISISLIEKPELFTKPAVKESLLQAIAKVKFNIGLITLNSKVKIEYEQREVKEISMEEEITAPITTASGDLKQEVKHDIQTQEPANYLVKTEPVGYNRSLEPVGLTQAYKLAEMFNKSGLYPLFKGPEQVMMILMRGRELGLGATTSLELINMIQGKPTMKASGLLALVMASPKCEYISCIDLSCTTCTWVTKRTGSPHESKRTFTFEDAKKMGLTSKDNWQKQPDVMLQWRAVSALIRQCYPDLINGLYAVEELE
jgi:5'-3' exonuclease